MESLTDGRGHGAGRLSAAARVVASLVALVAVIAGLTVMELRRVAASGRAVASIGQLGDDLASLLRLGGALERERGLAAGEDFVDAFGVPDAMVVTLTGVDLAGETVRAEADADESLAALGDRSPVSGAELATARAAGPTALAAVVDRIAVVRLERTAALRALARGEGVTGDLEASIDDLTEIAGLMPAVVDQTFTTLDVLVATDQSVAAAGVQHLVLAQGAVHAQLDALASRTNAVGGAVRALRDSTSYAELDRVSSERIRAHLDGEGAAAFDLAGLSRLRALWSSTVHNQELTTSILGVASTALDRAVDRVTATADARRLRSVGVLAAAALIMTASAAWILRTIVRPITALERHARMLSAGEPPEVPLALRGARELRVAAAAMNRLVDGLGLVERQATALARGDVDDPVLDHRLPGRLGTAITGAVSQLSASISTSRLVTDQLAYEATHDGLTHLANRRAAVAALEEATKRPDDDGRLLVAMFIDLDGFKDVNDLHGHEAGDEVLVAVARRLEVAVRAGDLVARLGGDEFLVVADDLAGPHDVEALHGRLRAAIVRPIRLGGDGPEVRVGASIGVATHLAGQPADELLRSADRAMYAEKSSPPRH